MKPNLTIGSLFSGIGGLDLGVERATGGTVTWQCEADPYCRRVLAKHWPGVPIFQDVVGLEPPPVDMLIGGFPCQDISPAGKKVGIDGGKSGLWGEYARIIGLLLPRFVFIENIADLASRGLARVLGDLASFGFNAEWDTLGACCVGAPHRRERLFILAARDTNSNSKSAISVHDEALRVQGLVVADSQSPRLEREGIPGSAAQRDRWNAESGIRRVDDGTPHRMDRLRGLGNSVVHYQAEASIRILARRLAS